MSNKKNTPIETHLEYLSQEYLSYKQMRDGYKEHTSQWEVYDLMLRQLMKCVEHAETLLPTERETIEQAFDAGKTGLVIKGAWVDVGHFYYSQTFKTSDNG